MNKMEFNYKKRIITKSRVSRTLDSPTAADPSSLVLLTP